MCLMEAEVESESSVRDGLLAEFLATAQQRRPQLLRIAQRMTMHTEDAEDVLQEAMMKAFRALPKFRGEAKMSTWLNAIVQNTALEHLRSRPNKVFLSIDCLCHTENGAVEFDLPDLELNPEERCSREELNRMLRAEINRLSFACRRPIELCALNETPQIEAARMLNTSIATVKSGVFRGKRILNRMIERRMQPPRRREGGANRSLLPVRREDLSALAS